MASLSKIDSVEDAIMSAGITNEDDVMAIREAVAGGESLSDAIAAFAPDTTALATSQPTAAPVVGKGGRKTKSSKTVSIDAQPHVGNADMLPIEDLAFEVGVDAAHEMGARTREQMAAGFKAQVLVEARETQQFLGSMATSFAGMLRGGGNGAA